MNDPASCKDDSPEISDSDRLLRRIHSREAPGGRIRPGAFEDFFLSVDVENKMEFQPLEFLGSAYPRNLLFQNRKKEGEKLLKKGWKVVALRPETPRNFGQNVYPEPCDVGFKDGIYRNIAHAKICGKKTDELCFELAEEANQNIILSQGNPSGF